MGAALPIVDLGTGRTAAALALGETHSCAVLDNGTMKCWGSNDYGQLGLSDTAHRGNAAGEMGQKPADRELGDWPDRACCGLRH
jgi:alpha-tubulin suppressor-like RCC1 family protein